MAFSLVGYIRDAQTKEPLPGVSITVARSSIGTASDNAGRFAINNLSTDNRGVTLGIHLIGYRDKTVKISTESGLPLEIFLEQSSWKMEDLVVTATRRKYLLKDVPVTTELISSDDFRKTGALTVDNALDSHIGVDISDDLSGRGITLRGIDPSRVLVLIDGNRVIGRVRGSIDLGQLPLNNVKQIEIVKGTGSTLYGSEAIGGVVNIITQDPLKTPNLNLNGQYGSFNSYDIQSGLNSGILGKGLALNAKFEHTDGFDLDKSTEHTDGLENISRFNLDSKTTVNLRPGWDIDVSAAVMAERKRWIESLISRGSSGQDTAYNFDDYEHNYRYDLAANSKWNLKDAADLSFGAHGSYYDHKWEKFTRSRSLSDISKSIDDIGELSLAYNRKLRPGHTFTFGGDAVTEGLRSKQLEVGNERIFHGDLYLQYEWRPIRQLIILPGVRWENHQTYGNHYNPSFNVMWNPGSLLTLRGSISRGFRAPSIKELYFEFDHSAAGYIVFGGGKNLRPEKSLNYSLTAETSYKQKAMHRLTYFRNDLKDLIDFDAGDFSDPKYPLGIYHYVNILKARTEGLEWETEIRMLDAWDLSFSYTYLVPENLTEGIDLINRPRHTLKFNTSYALKTGDTNINFWGNWHSRKLWTKREDTPDRVADNYAPSRLTLSVSVNKKLFKNLGVLTRIDNITDNKNAAYNYWPPRNFSIGLTYKIGRSK
jgi:outer membrane receptor for ferrienterochelin and colicins